MAQLRMLAIGAGIGVVCVVLVSVAVPFCIGFVGAMIRHLRCVRYPLIGQQCEVSWTLDGIIFGPFRARLYELEDGVVLKTTGELSGRES